MKIYDRDDISRTLRHFNNFAECIITEMTWLYYGTVLELSFNYVWDQNGLLRPDLQCEKLIVIRFGSIQEFHLVNALNEAVLMQPNEVNWGINEIAKIAVVRDSEALVTYVNTKVAMHHVAVLWEGKVDSRSIDIIFAYLEVEDGLLVAEN